MSQKEKEIFEAQLMKEAEIRDRLKEVKFIFLTILIWFTNMMMCFLLLDILQEFMMAIKQKV